jgi:hypothetical protein
MGLGWGVHVVFVVVVQEYCVEVVLDGSRWGCRTIVGLVCPRGSSGAVVAFALCKEEETDMEVYSCKFINFSDLGYYIQ